MYIVWTFWVMRQKKLSIDMWHTTYLSNFRVARGSKRLAMAGLQNMRSTTWYIIQYGTQYKYTIYNTQYKIQYRSTTSECVEIIFIWTKFWQPLRHCSSLLHGMRSKKPYVNVFIIRPSLLLYTYPARPPSIPHLYTGCPVIIQP